MWFMAYLKRISNRLEIVKSLRGVIPADFDENALREERIAKKGLL